ncbi:MAG TPA: GIY-YIG nuclease family protein [Candidatus Tenderia electrophaga]|uniref:GIY-YIG nuclease family protein n=1 Tax=Candidatus Tenderia electrophaga TaxID=1748243 RepID=A0A832J440_9GAMM|nr:GIY-YIG nuclease family protein [Candidatus Tenderia electrophaga]
MADKTDDWLVYIILCSDNTLYTGITNNIERRMQQHASRQGAKYFRGRRPQQLVHLEDGHDRSSASQREAAIKKLKRVDKEVLIKSPENRLDALAVMTRFK